MCLQPLLEQHGEVYHCLCKGRKMLLQSVQEKCAGSTALQEPNRETERSSYRRDFLPCP